MYVVCEKNQIGRLNMDRVLLANAMLALVIGPPPSFTEVMILRMPELPEEEMPLMLPDVILPRKPHLVVKDKDRNPYGKGSRAKLLRGTNQTAPGRPAHSARKYPYL